ncbi:MAG TPA: polynucleotide adenylyltransferase [Blastocatellia bacterium]|jgi:tRNA nucleotidyltransferase (CCA-adding enzyme)
MNEQVMRLCEAVREAGGRAMLVGGWVRDYLMGIQSKDFDVEVYRITPERLRSLLETLAPVNTVGEHFSVYKLAFREGERFEIDVSIPRRESKSGRGHRGFNIEGDPEMSFEEAARRRDFTMNAILYDPLTGEIVDPFNGAQDLKRRTLKAVAADTFIEDSLRVLRAVQFAARFEMTVDPGTVELCRTVELSDLPRERTWGEIEKLLTLAERPSTGLDAALQLGVLDKLFPEIRSLADCHLETASGAGMDAFTHTKLSLDEAAKLTRDLPKAKRISVMLAVLCLDLGRPVAESATINGAKPLDYGEASVEPARSLMNKLGLYTFGGYDARTQVLALVRDHLKPREFYKERERITGGDFRRLALRVNPALLYIAAKACAMGLALPPDAEDWFIEKARALGLEDGPPKPLLKGRHLLEIGLTPGPRLGEILRQVYELQLDGEATTFEEALAAARRFI